MSDGAYLFSNLRQTQVSNYFRAYFQASFGPACLRAAARKTPAETRRLQVVSIAQSLQSL